MYKRQVEVFTEIVRLVWTCNEDGKRVVKVLERAMTALTPHLPLLFVDGVFVEDPEVFLSIDALNVQTIEVIRKGYFFGKKEYQGVVLVTTKEGTYIPDLAEEYMLKTPLFLPQVPKRYFNQRYDVNTVEETKRIPDYRIQLFWDPNILLEGREKTFSVFTSDVPGTYEVQLEGITNKGVPVSVTQYFEVED